MYAARRRTGLFVGVFTMWALAAPCFSDEATRPSSIRRPEGFEVELLRSAQEGESSWISMTFDDRGRIILGRDDAGLARLTPGEGNSTWTYELIESSLKHCRGVLYAYDSLYVSATDSNGFYRLRDMDGDDRYESVVLLKGLDYRSRYGHGSNQIVLGPDGMIYLVVGNDVSFPEGTSPASPYRQPRYDRLLPDPHDAGQDDRVGYILRTDSQGTTWEVLAGGLRNQVDIAFNRDGEMFTYDADMEWDVGLPWYRPTRLNHVVSAGEYGWRWGTGKWPADYADSLPSTLDTGLGSPTGLAFGYGSRFPAKYQSGLFMGDWQNGRILLAQLTPQGASYSCQYEVFLEGGPLNVCDFVFGSDGAMYFITGGRGSQSGLYRVRYTGAEATAARIEKEDVAAAQARELRRSLETFHTRSDPKAIDAAWPHLDSDDLWIRYAARLALERQDAALWRERALGEVRPRAAIAALLALTRAGTPADLEPLLAAMERIPLARLDRSELTAALRVYELALIRWGRPQPTHAAALAWRLDAIYPQTLVTANRDLCELLVFLKSPSVLSKTRALVTAAATQEEQIHHVHSLARLDVGWTLDDRRWVLQWLQSAQSLRGGHLLPEIVRNMHSDIVAALTESERVELAPLLALKPPAAPAEPLLPPRPLVRQWRLEDFAGDLPLSTPRSLAAGQAALAAASCLKCHRLGELGTHIGPELTTVGKRFDARALLESILTPSKVMDPKYGLTAYVLADGRTVSGRPVSVTGTHIELETDVQTGKTETIERAAIEESFPSPVSPMPSGLIDVLAREEILDLLAYLQTGGDAAHAIYKGLD